MDKTSNVSLDINNHHDLLGEAMEKELHSLGSLSSTCSIYRVPERLLHDNEKCYRPNIVSIGPFHHGRKELQGMEEHKKRYLNDLLRETPGLSLGSYIEVIRQKEPELRACYAETIELTSDNFVKIILMDAAFIIGFLLRLKYDNMGDESDRIFGKPWLLQDIWLDMLLLENQLPFFILKDVYGHRMKVPGISGGDRVGIFDLSYNFFQVLMQLEVEEPKLEEIRSYEIKHFVDFLRHLYLPSPLNEPQESATTINATEPHGLQSVTTPNITELHRAGVKFVVGSSNNLFDLQFRNGRLEIPKLILGVETEISIRNLVAFEQCNFRHHYVNDYVVIMSRLVSTPTDVDLMVKYGIIENKLGNNEEGSFLINKLADGVILNYDEFYFANLCEELSNYCKNLCHNWMETLRQQYFNTPWLIIIFIVGVVTLTASIIQAVFSVLSWKSSNPNGRRT